VERTTGGITIVYHCALLGGCWIKAPNSADGWSGPAVHHKTTEVDGFTIEQIMSADVECATPSMADRIILIA